MLYLPRPIRRGLSRTMSQSSPSSPGKETPPSSNGRTIANTTLGIRREAERSSSLLHRTTSRASQKEWVNGENGHGHSYEGHGHGLLDPTELASRVEHGFVQGMHNLEAKIESEFGPVAVQHRQKLWARFRGKGRKRIGVAESAKNVAKSSGELATNLFSACSIMIVTHSTQPVLALYPICVGISFSLEK